MIDPRTGLIRRGPAPIPSTEGIDDIALAVDLATLRTEHAAAVGRGAVAKRELQTAIASRAEAEKDDARSYATAVRTGAKDPGAQHVVALAQREADAKRRADGEAAAAQLIRDDIEDLRDERASAWVADIDERRGTLLTSALDHLDAAMADVGLVRQLDAVRLWALTGRSKVAIPQVKALHASLPVAFAAIRELVASWEPTPEAWGSRAEAAAAAELDDDDTGDDD